MRRSLPVSEEFRTPPNAGDCRGRCCGPATGQACAYLERVAAHLQIRCGRFDDGDVAEAVQAARNGLAQK